MGMMPVVEKRGSVSDCVTHVKTLYQQSAAVLSECRAILTCEPLSVHSPSSGQALRSGVAMAHPASESHEPSARRALLSRLHSAFDWCSGLVKERRPRIPISSLQKGPMVKAQPPTRERKAAVGWLSPLGSLWGSHTLEGAVSKVELYVVIKETMILTTTT